MPQRGWRQRVPHPKKTPEQFSRDFYNAKILVNLLAPPCLGEALRRVYLKNLILMEESCWCPFFDYIFKRNFDVFHLM